MSKAEIDGVAAEFFSAFDNRGGKAADVDRVRRLVLRLNSQRRLGW
ncbi:hypothetical protein [Streptomyces sp. NBC_01314]|nr:hypothetical protein OG622_33995 [Streptomyces sp. NBC_01314]